MTISPQPNVPVAVVRPATRHDVDTIVDLDREAFGRRAYPIDFFYQQLELHPVLLYVADVGSATVGYGVGAVSTAKPDGWILSLAVAPAWRGHGLGTALTQTMVASLAGAGAASIYLSVQIDNTAARNLYQKLGFTVSRTEKDYFGPGEDRLIMQAPINAPVATPTRSPVTIDRDPSLLLGESQASIDFTSVLFAVSLAVLAIVASSLKKTPVMGVFLFLIVTATFYASIYYAVVAGNVARLERHSDVERAILYGNVLSEYFGVLLVIPVVPLLVWVVTASTGLAWMALIIALAGYWLYTLSGFDLIRRPIPSFRARVAVCAVYSILIATILQANIGGASWLSWAATAALLLIELVLAGIHLRRTETPAASP